MLIEIGPGVHSQLIGEGRSERPRREGRREGLRRGPLSDAILNFMKSANEGRKIACFISPHGFGHAARAAAIMEEMRTLDVSVRFEIFTMVPRWFFEQSLKGSFGYHPFQTDVGLVQQSPLAVDLEETLQRLEEFLPFDSSEVSRLAEKLRALGCSLVICDIAPLGISVAAEAGIASVLIENFTWDWIYEGYAASEPRLENFIHYLRARFQSADHHIQTEPICRRSPSSLVTRPVSRRVRTAGDEIRRRLGIAESSRAVLITMGGIPARHLFLDQLKSFAGTHFVIAGTGDIEQTHDNVTLIPRDSGLFHPDLVGACDAVVGKTGYSTVAEVYRAGIPFGFVARRDFRESEVLASFIEREMRGLALEETDFASGAWLRRIPELLALPRIERGPAENGAAQAARFLLGILHGRAHGGSPSEE